jgi:hypothetical protein
MVLKIFSWCRRDCAFNGNDDIIIDYKKLSTQFHCTYAARMEFVQFDRDKSKYAHAHGLFGFAQFV